MYLKKTLVLMSALLLQAVAVPVFGREKKVEIDGLHYELEDNKAVLVRQQSYNPTGIIVIPNHVKYKKKKYEVVIGEAAFVGCDDIIEVVIEDGITEIPDLAFNACQNLRTITIPKSVISIGRLALHVGESFETRTIDNVVYYNDIALRVKDSWLPYNTIREGTRLIANGAFGSCVNMKSITIPEGVVSICGGAFENCRSLERVELPTSLRRIESKAFFMCNKLDSISIPAKVDYIGSSAFQLCLSLKSLTIPRGVKEIGYLAFYKCLSLSSLTMPSSVKNIADNAFEGCENLPGYSFSDHNEYGVNNGHEYVDLGLSVKWATCNVGADKPSDEGDSYAWGEVETQYEPGWQQTGRKVWKEGHSGDYNYEDYKFFAGWVETPDNPYHRRESTFSKYNETDHKRMLDAEDDVAHVLWGGDWRLPTLHEFWELEENCTYIWSIENGVFGGKFISNVPGYEGRYIFMPAPILQSDSFYGCYWSCEMSPGPGSAYDFQIDDWGCRTYSDVASCNDLLVRPVCP